MHAHKFGKTDSPCCANWAFKSTPLDNRTEYSARVTEATLLGT